MGNRQTMARRRSDSANRVVDEATVFESTPIHPTFADEKRVAQMPAIPCTQNAQLPELHIHDANLAMDTIFESDPSCLVEFVLPMAYYFSFRTPSGNVSRVDFVQMNWFSHCDVVVFDGACLDSMLAATTLKIIYPRVFILTIQDVVKMEARSDESGAGPDVDDIFNGKNIILLHLFVFVPFRSSIFANAKTTFFIGNDVRFSGLLIDSVNCGVVHNRRTGTVDIPRVVMCCAEYHTSVTEFVWSIYRQYTQTDYAEPFFVQYADEKKSWDMRVDRDAVALLYIELARHPVELVDALVRTHCKTTTSITRFD